MKAINTALIGYGHLGRFHAQKIVALDLSNLVAIVEPSKAGQQTAKDAHPNVLIVNSIDELPANVEAAIVVTPTSFHFDLCKKLIEKNIHIFCEKPVTDKLEDSLTLQSLMKDKKLVFQVGHSERCHEAWEQKGLMSPYLGAGAHLRLDRYAAFKGRATDVDVVNDLMIHDLDLLRYLLGQDPVNVSATGFKQRTNKWDHVVAHFTFTNGCVADITVGRGHVHEVRSLEGSSEHGVLRVDLMNSQIQIAHKEASEIKVINYTKRDHLLMEQENFYRSINEGSTPMVTLEDGVKAVKLIDAVLRSLETKNVVNL
ncbi:MAG: hypothetical protein COW01_09270 [Bdellovibrionales bacterium CG12_big_fil_rev_8_21_14_0_65_38_15]|nr:MAG: hypothetical protein COW79_09275 [Bdellovibrionales bacterium CG22_combo_CG10-13_8_21_14_all_38_13]PIQ54718.1 MAG: hypothetical protein COW01_09270 [Bdellovibrionales bacterium CG12_big_fil_rev_8_21_14_0_65_38_15]PIR30866.1 MAG: hypothetical protein COV38_03455 [Bdellovibrionales bacterium CG11_big_fil_rev_8_21_14_0_20_38_13]